MIIDQYKTLYYRGYLRSCNYGCGYCPFSKKTADAEELAIDKSALDKFTHFLNGVKTTVTIFIVPYGEALIHDYYLETIAKMSSRNYIDKICIQTNNSFPLQKLLFFLSKYNGSIDKIRLWCTYHPTQVSGENFVSKCNSLYEAGIKFSVGAVADCAEISSLKLMREQLPSDIYMWLNKMDGSNRKYNSLEIKEFLNIDPLFELQLMKIKSDINKCIAGRESIFIDYKGNMFPCNVSKHKIGNIYEDFVREVKCGSAYCSCFLAYSNRNDLPLLNLFKDERHLRILPNDNIVYALHFFGYN